MMKSTFTLEFEIQGQTYMEIETKARETAEKLLGFPPDKEELILWISPQVVGATGEIVRWLARVRLEGSN